MVILFNSKYSDGKNRSKFKIWNNIDGKSIVLDGSKINFKFPKIEDKG
jgi:hypothetical protein